MDEDSLSPKETPETKPGDGDVTYSDLYEKYSIKRAYQHPSSYDEGESYYGNGKYPPDWSTKRDDVADPIGGRKEAIYEYQHGSCARCNRSLDEYGYHCHHYLPLSNKGTNELQNLVGLCESCHKLIHPNNDGMDGDWRDAPLFPHSDADRRVATIRKAVHALENQQYDRKLRLLEATSAPGENDNSTSDATYSLSATDALTAQDSLDQMLRHRGLEPRGRAVIEAIDQTGSPATDHRVEVKVYFEEYDPVLLEERTDDRGRVEVALPEHTVAYARLYNAHGEQIADTELTATSDGWRATIEPPNVGCGASNKPESNVARPAATEPASSGSSGGASSDSTDSMTDILIGSLLAPFYLFYVAVKYIVLFFLAIIFLNIMFGIPLGVLKILLDMWTGSPYGFGSGATYLITFVGLAFVVSWSVFWLAVWENVDE